MSHDDYSTMKAKSFKLKHRYDPIKEQGEKAILPFMYLKRIISLALHNPWMRGIIILLLACGVNTLFWMMIISCILSTSLCFYLKSVWMLKKQQRRNNNNSDLLANPFSSEKNSADDLNYYLGADISLIQEGLKHVIMSSIILQISELLNFSLVMIGSTCTECLSLLKQLFQKEHVHVMNKFTSIELVLLQQHNISNNNDQVQDINEEQKKIEQMLIENARSMNVHCTFVTSEKDLISLLNSQKMDVTLILQETLRPYLDDNTLQQLVTVSRNNAKLGVVIGDYERSSLIHSISQNAVLCSAFRISEWQQWLFEHKILSPPTQEESFKVMWTFGRITTILYPPSSSTKVQIPSK